MEGRYAKLNAGVNRPVSSPVTGAKPRLVDQPELLMMGIEVQLATQQRVQPGSTDLTKLWNRFLSEQLLFDIPEAINPQILYGLYTDYSKTDYSQPGSKQPHLDHCRNDNRNDSRNGSQTCWSQALIVATQVSSIDNPPESMVGLAIPPARYLVFSAPHGSGSAQIWQQVWDYFAAEPGDTHRRAYTIDFERHELDQISVYIAVK
jgi:predicted transcriptional regulator YdeE